MFPMGAAKYILLTMLAQISPKEDGEGDLIVTEYFLISRHFIPALQFKSKHTQVKLAICPCLDCATRENSSHIPSKSRDPGSGKGQGERHLISVLIPYHLFHTSNGRSTKALPAQCQYL